MKQAVEPADSDRPDGNEIEFEDLAKFYCTFWQMRFIMIPVRGWTQKNT